MKNLEGKVVPSRFFFLRHGDKKKPISLIIISYLWRLGADEISQFDDDDGGGGALDHDLSPDRHWRKKLRPKGALKKIVIAGFFSFFPACILCHYLFESQI